MIRGLGLEREEPAASGTTDLCEERLARTGWAKHKDTSPRRPAVREEVRHAERHDYGLFELALDDVEPSDIVPVHVGLLDLHHLLEHVP